uniref:Uncharacterized protein n=1 Tax=Anguilla anguilla TaxID=7936 RepID=A0A0E9W984_ANGAN
MTGEKHFTHSKVLGCKLDSVTERSRCGEWDSGPGKAGRVGTGTLLRKH